MQGNIFIDTITGIYNYNPMENGYFNTGNIHIILGCRRDYIPKLIKYLEGKQHHRIHLFATDPYVINESLDHLIEECLPQNKLIIHVPVFVKDMYILMKDYLKDIKGVRVFKEKEGPSFSLARLRYPRGYYYLKFEYKEYGIEGYIRIMFNNYMNYNWGCDKNVPLSNRARIFYPELFKDDIIRDFKKVTPAGILNSFSNDEDIWDFIMEGKK